MTLTVTNTVGSLSRQSHGDGDAVSSAQPPVAGFYGTPVAQCAAGVNGGGSTGIPITGSHPS